MVGVCPPTNHEVRHTAEDDGGDGPQCDDVRQDLRQEVDRQSVVTADVLVSARKERLINTLINQGSSSVCVL